MATRSKFWLEISLSTDKKGEDGIEILLRHTTWRSTSPLTVNCSTPMPRPHTGCYTHRT